MANSFFSRTARLISAQIEGVLDKAEEASALPLMKQSVQEIEATIDAETVRKAKAEARITQNELRLKELTTDVAAWKERASFALGKEREDLAREALAETVRLAELSDRVSSSTQAAHDAISEADDTLEQLRALRDDLRGDLYAAQREDELERLARSATEAATPVPSQMERAQALFERSARLTAKQAKDDATDQGSKLAIDALRREEAIEAELAALKKPAKRTRRKKSDS